MDIRIAQSMLADALATVRPASRWHAIMPALNNVLLSTTDDRLTVSATNNVLLSTTDDRLTVSATNLEVYIERTLLMAEVAQPGAICVPLCLLAEFVRGLPDEIVRLTTNGSTLHIECGAFEANIKGLAAEEFPLVSEPADVGYISLDADTFANMVDSVAPAAAQDQTRPVLAGVLVTIGEGAIRMDAADGYRLHHRVEPSHSDIVHSLSAIVPTDALRQIAKNAHESMDSALDGARLFARSDDTRIVAQLIEGEYPDLSTVIPAQQNTSVLIARDEFARAARMAHVFARDVADAMRVSIVPPNAVIITAQSVEHGDNVSELSGKVDGPAVEFRANTAYMLDALNAMDTASVRLAVNDSTTPITLRPEYGRDIGAREMVAVIMPMYESR